MATFYSDLQTVTNGPAYGQPLATRVKANKQHGRIRFMEAVFVVPAATLAIADKIVWGKLPQKAKIIGHLSKLTFTAGTASSTVNLGDNVVPARHLAATSVASAGSAVPSAAEQVNSSTADTVAGSNVITAKSSFGAYQLGSLIAGTGIPSNTTITGISGVSITLSNAATATGSAVAMTVTGGTYETQEDSNNVSNGFASATDDCTLTSVVAGAVLAAGQVLTLKVAYVQD